MRGGWIWGFWFILPKRFIFTQADDFSRNSVRFLVLFWSWSRGILLGMLWIPPFSVGIVFFQFLLSPSPVHFPQVVWRSFIKEWDPSVPFALFSRGFFFFFLGDSSGPQAIALFVHRRVAYRRLLLLFGCFPSLEFPVWNKTGFLSSGCASKKDSVQKPTSPFWCFSCPFFFLRRGFSFIGPRSFLSSLMSTDQDSSGWFPDSPSGSLFSFCPIDSWTEVISQGFLVIRLSLLLSIASLVLIGNSRQD